MQRQYTIIDDTESQSPQYTSKLPFCDNNLTSEIEKLSESNPKAIKLAAQYHLPEEWLNLYKYLPDNVETVVGSYRFFSIRQILEMVETNKKYEQNGFIDIAFKYMGMGHVMVLSYNYREDGLYFFTRRDGGSSGYDREYNFEYYYTKYNTPDGFSFEKLRDSEKFQWKDIS